MEENKEEEKEERIYDYDSKQDEIEYVTNHLPASESYDDDSIRISIFHSMLKNCEMAIKFTSDYPNTPLSCQIKTRTLPPKLQDIIRKGADKRLEELAEEGKYQVLKIYEYYNDLMENNNLIPAWREIQMTKKLLDPKKDSMKLFQKAGKVKFTLEEKELRLALMVTIPPEYPLNPLGVKIMGNNKENTGTNIEEQLIDIFNSHMQELVRRYHQGYDGLESNINEGKIGEAATKKIEAPLMTYEEMKYDIDFLRRQAEMKEVLEDKVMRKKYRRIMRKEQQREIERIEMEEKRIQELQKRNAQAKPCFYELIDFAINQLVRYFPNAVCKICNEALMIKNKKKRNESNAPQIAYCLHWFHAKCIEDCCNSPPFNPNCPVEGCEQQLGNKDNKTDKLSVKARERAFSQIEARRSEADDIDTLFTF